MLYAAGPFILQCAWRSYYPEIYNKRVTFWDSWLCSAFIGRMLATYGEVTFMIQVGCGLIFQTQQLKD